ncbi:DUF1737 domain-containing protein [Notoacmeibacter ruber]|uniref:DUF1737 domain-containing protein n=1 Tax=Notoacmeibacter ruber TaxID=2670375 RepID=A0A3L7JED4_9HYPH|nr:DUF1737 domain-containing protein [Notoacmeibacter ruber]RLQ89138.1 DUF1737 domain-containing protein [Notoacmeibacter ruber]
MQLYRVLTGPDDSGFCHKVSAALSKGWTLHGDPSYAHDPASGSMRVAQAVTKTVEGKTYSPEMKLGEQ